MVVTKQNTLTTKTHAPVSELRRYANIARRTYHYQAPISRQIERLSSVGQVNSGNIVSNRRKSSLVSPEVSSTFKGVPTGPRGSITDIKGIPTGPRCSIPSIKGIPIGPRCSIVGIKGIPKGPRGSIAGIKGVPTGPRGGLANIKGVPTGPRGTIANIKGIPTGPRSTITDIKGIPIGPRGIITDTKVVPTGPRGSVAGIKVIPADPCGSIADIKVVPTSPRATITNIKVVPAGPRGTTNDSRCIPTGPRSTIPAGPQSIVPIGPRGSITDIPGPFIRRGRSTLAPTFNVRAEDIQPGTILLTQHTMKNRDPNLKATDVRLSDTQGGAVITKLRPMICLAKYPAHAVLLPMFTFSGRGLHAKPPKVHKEYMGIRWASDELYDNQTLYPPLEVEDGSDLILREGALVHLSYPVYSQYVDVNQILGSLTDNSMDLLKETFSRVMNEGLAVEPGELMEE